MTSSPTHMELSLIEAAHLTELVGQLSVVLEPTLAEDPRQDPAVARLVPDAYAHDPDAAAEFRRLTQDDLLDRRRTDAARVAQSLRRDGTALSVAELEEADADGTIVIALDADTAASWLRTLTALRLVLATRLEVTKDDDHEQGDPRFGLYDWLGYRLEVLVQSLDI